MRYWKRYDVLYFGQHKDFELYAFFNYPAYPRSNPLKYLFEKPTLLGANNELAALIGKL